MYMRLFYLRRFENLMVDMAVGEPLLERLIAMVERYNTAVIDRYLELGAEMMGFGDDLGLQQILPMGPALWRRYIKPSYERMFRRCRERKVPISLHTDGHIVEIIPDLVEVGVLLLNPQIRANGLESLVRLAKGTVALNQDLDRQLFPVATPSQIEAHIREVFDALYLPAGGLMLHAECEPDVPLENVEVICRTLETLCKPPGQARQQGGYRSAISRGIRDPDPEDVSRSSGDVAGS
jgi:uroporphyrinogen decarboxylase